MIDGRVSDIITRDEKVRTREAFEKYVAFDVLKSHTNQTAPHTSQHPGRLGRSDVAFSR